MKLPEGVTKQQVEAWKQEHGVVQMYDIDGHKIIAHRPTRGVVNQWEKFNDSDPNKARTILVSNCVLHGKEEALAKDELFYSTALAIATNLIPLTKAEVTDL